MRIEYVTVPVAKRAADLEKSHRLWAPRFKEYESIIPRRNETEKRSPGGMALASDSACIECDFFSYTITLIELV